LILVRRHEPVLLAPIAYRDRDGIQSAPAEGLNEVYD